MSRETNEKIVGVVMQVVFGRVQCFNKYYNTHIEVHGLDSATINIDRYISVHQILFLSMPETM